MIGDGLGPPKSPKSAPVQPLVQVQVPGSPGPACERSTRFEPPETLCVVGSDEFTWMLRLGPPQILIVMPPFPLNVLGLLGWVMIIGIGETLLTIAAVAIAVTFGFDEFKNFINVVVTCL